MNGREVTAIAVVFIAMVLMPITIGVVVRLLKGAVRPAVPAADPMMNARMERLEQAMDAIAIEIERISEGQRFMTKVLTQPAAQSAPADRQVARQSVTPH